MSSFTFPSVYPVCLPQVPLVALDSFFYGKLVIAPLNILLYNVFTPHGPDLYGNIQEHTSLMYDFISCWQKSSHNDNEIFIISISASYTSLWWATWFITVTAEQRACIN